MSLQDKPLMVLCGRGGGGESNTPVTEDDKRHYNWIRRTECQWELERMASFGVDVLECKGLIACVHVLRVENTSC